jgi:ribosome-binding protein aMBF1 (putative translation factor)
MNNAKEIENGEFICDFCGFKADGKNNINKHIDKHRNLCCNACGKKYGTSSNLKHHLRSHFDKNFLVMCDFCG